MFVYPCGFDSQRARDLLKQGQENEAVTYINQFVERGSVRAMIAMADYWYDKGDKEVSLSWMDRAEQSITQDNFDEWLYVASANRRGLGHGDAEERYHKAFEIQERVAESGNVAVMFDMMENCLHGLNGAKQSHERFIYWANKAAALGSEDAAQVLREEGLPVPGGEVSSR